MVRISAPPLHNTDVVLQNRKMELNALMLSHPSDLSMHTLVRGDRDAVLVIARAGVREHLWSLRC